ncbi:MAG: hypothetical protein ACAI25_19340, partial [Planctomycetota bacterium]
MKRKSDPTAALRRRALRFKGAAESVVCARSAFKVGKKSFAFLGATEEACDLMVKLDGSLDEAAELAARDPERYRVGATGWVTARFGRAESVPLAA